MMSRWAAGGRRNNGYGEKFGELVATGGDVDGEARLADALVPRAARVLDAGSGMGRVGAALAARGHQVVGVDPDRALVTQSRRTYPGLEIVETDILGLSPTLLAGRGLPTEFDLVVCVGNVMIFLADGTERAALTRLRELLAPGGRVLVGFHPVDGPTTSRTYPPDEFAADATAAGLRVDLRAGSYQLHPADEGYAVWVLSRANAATVPTSFGHPTVFTGPPDDQSERS